jgi:hypothetical protein
MVAAGAVEKTLIEVFGGFVPGEPIENLVVLQFVRRLILLAVIARRPAVGAETAIQTIQQTAVFGLF